MWNKLSPLGPRSRRVAHTTAWININQSHRGSHFPNSAPGLPRSNPSKQNISFAFNHVDLFAVHASSNLWPAVGTNARHKMRGPGWKSDVFNRSCQYYGYTGVCRPNLIEVFVPFAFIGRYPNVLKIRSARLLIPTQEFPHYVWVTMGYWDCSHFEQRSKVGWLSSSLFGAKGGDKKVSGGLRREGRDHSVRPAPSGSETDREIECPHLSSREKVSSLAPFFPTFP